MEPTQEYYIGKPRLKKYADGKLLKYCEFHQKIYLNACCYCIGSCSWELWCLHCRKNFCLILPFPIDVANEIVNYIAPLKLQTMIPDCSKIY